jgi:hypothetical protein
MKQREIGGWKRKYFVWSERVRGLSPVWKTGSRPDVIASGYLEGTISSEICGRKELKRRGIFCHQRAIVQRTKRK